MFSVAADVRNLLGECPLWCERTRRLYWTDIEGRELLTLEEDDNVVMRWSLPECWVRSLSSSVSNRHKCLIESIGCS